MKVLSPEHFVPEKVLDNVQGKVSDMNPGFTWKANVQAI
jgi:hypothetical protein